MGGKIIKDTMKNKDIRDNLGVALINDKIKENNR